MAKQKRKLTPSEKRAKKKRREETMMIFVNGKQKRVKRPPTIDGMPAEEFLWRNADPVWLHQNQMWHLIDQEPAPWEGLRSNLSSNEWEAKAFDLQEVNKYLASLAHRPDEEPDVVVAIPITQAGAGALRLGSRVDPEHCALEGWRSVAALTGDGSKPSR